MRRLLFSLLLLCSLSALADATNPPGLQPLPEPPPPPPGFQPEATPEPEITIKTRGQNQVEEYRINGRLYMLKITPPHGVPYYLIDDNGSGQFTRRDDAATYTRIPMWVLGRF